MREGYPGIAGTGDNFARAQPAGFAPIDHFTLPPAAWWDGDYAPLEQRLARRAPAAAARRSPPHRRDRREIELFRSYNYGSNLLRRGH